MRLNRLTVSFVLCGSLLLSSGCSHQNKASESAESAGAVTSKEVTYSSGTTQLKGFIAYPAGNEKRPAVLVVHEWWGLDDYVKSRVLKLAEAGYVAMAIDMY